MRCLVWGLLLHPCPLEAAQENCYIDDAFWEQAVAASDFRPLLHICTLLQPQCDRLPPPAAIAAQKKEEENQQRAMAARMQPMLDAMASNPQFVDMLMQMQPELREQVRNNPRLEQELRDPNFLREMLRAGVDPDARRMTERQLSAAIAQVNAIPGGQAMLEGEVMRTLGTETSRAERSAADLHEVAEERARPKEGVDSNAEGLPNPWGAPSRSTVTQPFGRPTTMPLPFGFAGTPSPLSRAQPQTSVSAATFQVSPEEERKLSLMLEMGFDNRQANLTALRRCQGDVDAAVCWLAEQP